jgi:hypothetical protein
MTEKNHTLVGALTGKSVAFGILTSAALLFEAIDLISTMARLAQRRVCRNVPRTSIARHLLE